MNARHALTRYLVLALLPLLLAWPAAGRAQGAAPTLRIRLVRAAAEGALDPGLEDVAALLRQNMAFRSYRLLDTRRVALPAHEPLVFAGGLKMTLQGKADALDITISRGRATLIKTRAAIRGRAPLLIGGITDADRATLLFVIDLR